MSFLRRFLSGESRDQAGRAPGADDADLSGSSDDAIGSHAHRHRVTVWWRLHDAGFENEREQQRVFALENAVMRALDDSGVGEHDTNALEHGFMALRLVGDDADAVVAVVLPLLAAPPPGSYLAVRRGPAGSVEERLELDARGQATSADAAPARDPDRDATA